MAVGYGLTPYGAGDWGSESSFVPGVGALSIQSEAPIVHTGIIPSGGAVLIGSAPVVVVIERVKTPGAGAVWYCWSCAYASICICYYHRCSTGFKYCGRGPNGCTCYIYVNYPFERQLNV
jgi:hypothetical protein